MKQPKTDNAEILSKPEFGNTRTMLRGEIVHTRQLGIMTAKMAQIQQQVAARHNEGAFWSGRNSLPIEGVLFVGESGSGKSYGLRYGVQTLPAIKLMNRKELASKPVYIDTPTEGTIGHLAKAIVHRADGAEMREPKDKDAPGKAIGAFGRHHFTMVAIDEISRIINPQRHSGRALEVQSHLVWTLVIEALNLPASPTPIVLSGLPLVLNSFQILDRKQNALQVRREAQRRMNIVVLPKLDIDLDGEILAGAIASYCQLAKVESMLTDSDQIIPRLIHASYEQIGTALEWAQKAVALASLRPNGKLNRSDFAYVYGAMTDAATGANPFTASQWDRINIGKIAPKSFAEAVAKIEVA